jgi:hypothetical protein
VYDTVYTQYEDNPYFSTWHVLKVLGVKQASLDKYIAHQNFPRLRFTPGTRMVNNTFPRTNSARYPIEEVNSWILGRIGKDTPAKVAERLRRCLVWAQARTHRVAVPDHACWEMIAAMSAASWARAGRISVVKRSIADHESYLTIINEVDSWARHGRLDTFKKAIENVGKV